MQIKSGLICLTKKEKEEFNVLVEHITTDLSWGENGSFGDGDKLYKKEYNQSIHALSMLKLILKHLVI